MLSFSFGVGPFQVLAFAVDATRLIRSACGLQQMLTVAMVLGRLTDVKPCDGSRQTSPALVSSRRSPASPCRLRTFLVRHQRELNGAKIITEEVYSDVLD